MSASAELRVVHVASGRVRVRWPQTCGAGEPEVSHLLASITGAQAVRANGLTQNVLVQFDERLTTANRVLDDLREAAATLTRRAARGKQGDRRRGRPSARPTVQPGVASPSPRQALDERAALELLERAARTAGAFGGIFIVAIRGRRADPLPASRSASAVGAAIALFDGFPDLRVAADRLLGRGGRVALLGGVGIAAHTLSGSPLGLAVAALVSTRQLFESLARRHLLAAYSGRRPSLGPPGESGIRFAAGDRVSVAGRVRDGVGFAVERDGLLGVIGPGSEVVPGARVHGGPFVIEPHEDEGPNGRRMRPRHAEEPGRQAAWVEAAAVATAVISFLATRSMSRAIGVLLLLSRRPEILGREGADAGASLRVLRAGALPVDAGLVIRRPDVVLVESPRVISDGFEVARTDLLGPSLAASEAAELALSVATLAGSPWGSIRGLTPNHPEGEGSFDGQAAHAVIGECRYTLAFEVTTDARPDSDGYLPLTLGLDGEPLAVVQLRPRLSADSVELATTCRRLGVELALAHVGAATKATRSLARKAGMTLLCGTPDELVRCLAGDGRRVALVTDSGNDADALTHGDLSIGLATGVAEGSGPAVDVLVPDLATAAAVVEAGARRDVVVRDQRLLSSAATALGGAWIVAGTPRHDTGARLTNLATIAGLLVAWVRLRGGAPPRSTAIRLVDPHPEQWGRRTIDDVLRALASGEGGLSRREAAARLRIRAPTRERHALVAAATGQVRSPLTGILAVGAGLSLATGALADVVLISAVIALNVLLGTLQERQTRAAAEELERMGQVSGRVLRDGRRIRLPASELAPGDILFLSSGDRVAADARVLRSRGLEVDEASLTGESLPVAKHADGGSPEARVVLDGTDVTVGSGRAIVFAAGTDTRFGATVSALAGMHDDESPLQRRLHRMLLEVLPVVVGGGALVILAGLLWRRPLSAQLALGAGTAIAAVPEGLPLLASLGEAAVAKRLASRDALVRRLTAVETLGRVDVACIDKTGTLTENRLSLHLVVGATGERAVPTSLPESLRQILRCAALASPRMGSSAGAAHATDAAVIEGARAAGLAVGLDEHRDHEIPFDASRQFHGALVDHHVYVKGSAEELTRRCTRIRRDGDDGELDDDGRNQLLALAHELAGEGLRVLMVAVGSSRTSLRDPDDLVALGFLGIRDTLRPGIAAAIGRCREAGIRLIMVTGDHAATAEVIGREIGLLDGGRVLTGPEIEELAGDELARALEGASVIARIAPLEKLRIVEALRRRGHVVAMTGDGVNDAPALRLADVGVAMGQSGTEVARQAGDLVLATDDLLALVDALIEGRTFWTNLRRALALLLGGNLGEVAFIVALAGAGFSAPLTARQVLAVNLVSDVLPAISLVVQPPRERDLSRLAREGEAALGAPLRREILVRAAATATPALAAYITARIILGPQRAQSVGFASIVLTQLTQTLDASRAEGGASRATTAAVGGSTALLAAALHLRTLQTFLRLAAPGTLGWIVIALAGTAAPMVAHALGENGAGQQAALATVADGTGSF